MTSSVHLLPWQHYMLPWHRVLPYHPCSVRHGTGKLNFNIIYSKRRQLQAVAVVVLIYIFLGRESLNYLPNSRFLFLNISRTANVSEFLQYYFSEPVSFFRYKSRKGEFLADSNLRTGLLSTGNSPFRDLSQKKLIHLSVVVI